MFRPPRQRGGPRIFRFLRRDSRSRGRLLRASAARSATQADLAGALQGLEGAIKAWAPHRPRPARGSPPPSTSRAERESARAVLVPGTALSLRFHWPSPLLQQFRKASKSSHQTRQGGFLVPPSSRPGASGIRKRGAIKTEVQSPPRTIFPTCCFKQRAIVS